MSTRKKKTRTAQPRAAAARPSKRELFPGGSETAALMRKMDWAATPLGPTGSWSPALRMMSEFLLANRFPQLLWWGPQFCCLYNDAYAPILGLKHPWAMGRPTQEVWSEIWHILEPLIKTPYQGGPATWMEDIALEIQRRGFVEETHFTIAYSPVPDETVSNGIGGVLATVHEISEKVVGERRVGVLRDLGARSAEPKSAEEACTIAAHALERHAKDIPFALLYLIDEKRTQAYFAASTGMDSGDRVFPRILSLGPAGEETWPFATAMEKEEIQLVRDLPKRFEKLPSGPWSEPPNSAAVVPIRSNVTRQLAGFMVVGISPRLEFDESYRNFLELVSTQIAVTIANARAYADERKRSEALAELDRAKTLFFSNVSHEFRTPLTLMLGPLEDVLGAGGAMRAEDRVRLDAAHRNAVRLLRLVNTLLDFSRLEAGRIQASFEPTDLAALTTELASMFQSATDRAGLRLVVDCPPIAEPVYVDRDMWEKILFNLLSNAFKFTFEGEIAVSLRTADGAVELAVRDTGTGIPSEELPRLFQRFYRAKGAHGRTFEGSGIGLSLVQELAKLHGGTVRVQSEQGRGSTFTISIPLGKDHLSADRIGAARALAPTGLPGAAYVQEALRWLPGAEPSSDEAPIENLLSTADPMLLEQQGSEAKSRILLADDNADMRHYIQRLLHGQYEVETVADGQSALEAARRRCPDLILSDIMMPRLDGFGLLQALRADESLKNIPVILLSARAGEESRIEGLQSGADDYLIKPFSARELLARVKSHLTMAQIRNEAREVERELRLDAELLAAIVASSDDAIISKDLNGVINSWNQAAERIFGYTAQEAVGQPITLIIPRDRWAEETDILGRLRRGERIDHFQTVRMRKDGTTLDVSLTISPVRDSSGRIIGASKVARDITQQRRAEERERRATAEAKVAEENYRKLAETLDVEVQARTRELEERNAEVLTQSEQLRELSWRLLRTQDEERRHVARELHDSAGQTLTVLGISLALFIQKAARNAPELATDAAQIQESIQQLHTEIRTASYLLHPPLLDENGLTSALDWYVQGLIERSGLAISLQLPKDLGRLPRDMELAIFRLVQECLTNIHRHSASKTACIQLTRHANRIALTVEDSGKGMSRARLAEIQSGVSGLGIRGIRERLLQIGGNLEVESDSSGTKVSVSIPLSTDATSEEQSDNDPLRATA